MDISGEKMQISRFVAIFTILPMVLGCTGIKVSQDYNLSKDFSGLKTYAWRLEKQKKADALGIGDPFLDARIRNAIDRFLSDKGYQKISRAVPDFYVRFQHRVQRKIESDDVRATVGFGTGGRGRYGGIGINTGSSIRAYDEGLLVIDILGTDPDDLLWRGKATQRISQHSDPEKMTTNVNETVEKILSQFPPEPKK